MRSELNGDDLYSLVLMLATAEEKEIVLVEDDNDCIVYRQVVDQGVANLVPGYGKETVEAAMDRVVQQGQPEHVLAILDRDFVGLGVPPHRSSDVIYTVLYDLEAELLAVDDLADRVAAAHCKEDAWRRVGEIDGVPLLDWLVNSCAPLGAARRVSTSYGYGLRLRDFPMNEFISVPDGANVDRLCELAMQRSKTTLPSEVDLRAQVELTLNRTADPRDLCSGHDLFRALGLLIRTTWGGTASGETLERSARAAVTDKHISKTGVYRRIEQWQHDSGRTVLTPS